jgi:hypothetical protein
MKFKDYCGFSANSWALLHDSILDVTGESLDQEALGALYEKLPQRIKAEADKWSLSDTLVRENIAVWVDANGV